ncbi:MAG: bifunctional diguanylate cyclase/phosphodiesterase, partial [Candidatus Magnetoovum sp. WYHC-5]|nr:bifunctional diguanylate cyclase/phosphodiesterase [Candidatus Magnetoovum sp. WYHC-5]
VMMSHPRISPACNLFTVFQIDNVLYDLEIFWKNEPDAEIAKKIEHIIKVRLTGDNIENLELKEIGICHNVADNNAKLPDFDIDKYSFQIKSLSLKSPQIGGVVGIYVQTEVVKDPIRALVLDSILTTLINVIGSIKAIYKYTRELEFYATRDPLTNLFNQRMFWELFTYEIGRAHRHGYDFPIMIIDFDNFKLINDRYGHNFGDKYLQTFSSVIRDVLREGDLMFRYGGDEFAIILPNMDDEQTYIVANRIKDKVEGQVLEAPDGAKVKGTISIGVAMYPHHAQDVKTLFLVADNMMYKAKKEGKNKIGIPTKDELADAIHQKKEKSIFLLSVVDEIDLIIPYFQPVVNLENSKVEISEMLMRLKYNDRILAAGEFIDTAEKLGIIHKLDKILIEKAFRKIQKEDYQGTLFINLSPRALIISEFISILRRLTMDYNINPSKIVFEITERETVKNISLLERFVKDLKYEGFHFAIDDFGSGFSSFQYVKHFPIDYIKIEGEFIKNMASDSMDLAFVKSIITLAKELNIKTIAEFVENAEILLAIKKHGVNYGQGYFIEKPIPELLPLGSKLERVSEVLKTNG